MIAVLGLGGGFWLLLVSIAWLAERGSWANQVAEWLRGGGAGCEGTE